MIRSGLIFAGFNNWIKGNALPTEIGDGLLTANDVLSLDLAKQSLLVLSACQTGLGEMQSGEGAKGLRRAFELAGVTTLICTLWSISDFGSSLLMKKFYETLLTMPTKNAAEALSAAKEYIRTLTIDDLYDMGLPEESIIEDDVLRIVGIDYRTLRSPHYDASVQGNNVFAHPFYWDGFIVQGNCRIIEQ